MDNLEEKLMAIQQAYNKGLLNGAEQERLRKEATWEKIAKAVCPKCGVDVAGDDAGLCYRCV